MSQKINEDDILNSDISIFGEWINENIQLNNNPFKHCVIENFLDDSNYNKIRGEFPDGPNDNFWKYNNPIEVKYTLDKFEYIGKNITNLFYALSHEKLVTKIGQIFNIDNLEYDPYLHGGGIHLHPRNGRLNMHLDYEKHPKLNKQRRLNIIYYINDEWNHEWNGDTQLWNEDLTECIKKIYPKKNRAIIFETIEKSWHGVPDKIKCPKNIYRKSLAYYYISPLINKSDKSKIGSNDEGFRTKAAFKKRPNEKDDDRMNKLYDIRPYRRITKEDMNNIWPEWTPDF